MKNFYKWGLLLALFLFVGCDNETLTQPINNVKSPQNTTKHIRALAEDKQDWTWFVGTDGTRAKDALTFDVYFMKNIPQEVQHFQYFLDVDNDALTGFSFGRDSWRISGADYLIEDGEFYKSTSKTEWSWTHVGSFETYEKSEDKGVGHIQISTNKQDVISLVTSDTVNITIEPFDKDWGSTYSTISSQAVAVPLIDNQNNQTMIIDPTRPNAYINLHDSTPKGLYYQWVKDDFVQKNEKVLELHSHGIENSFHLLGYETNEKYTWNTIPSHQDKMWISWDSKFSNDFIIYIVLNFTTKSGDRVQKDIVYTPSVNGYANYTDSFMHIYLGESADDGHWHHYRRNLLDDLHTFYPEASLSYVNATGYINGIAIRGSGRITNLMFSQH